MKEAQAKARASQGHDAGRSPAVMDAPTESKPNQNTWRTTPNKERGGELSGERTVNEPNEGPVKKRAIAIENRTAEILRDAGYDVEQNPDVPGTKKNPDYRINGSVFDCYAPEEGTSADNIVQAINYKVGKGQADRIVLNLQDSDVTRHELREALNDLGSERLKELIVVDQNGNIIRFYP